MYILYSISMLIGIVCIHLNNNIYLFVIFPVWLWSLYQDWSSARIVERKKVIFSLLDILTVFCYIGLFVAVIQEPNLVLGYSPKIWLYWGLVFVIYIVWNLTMMRLPDIEKNSKRFFLIFSIIEIPIALCCLIFFLESNYLFISKMLDVNILSYPNLSLIIFAILHGIILFYWVYKTYITKK